MINTLWRRGAILAVFAMALTSCNGDDNDDGGSTGPTGSIQLAVSPATVSIPQGGNATVTVTLQRGGGFSGAVTVAVEGLTTGITAVVTPTSLTGITTSATITVTVSPAVALATYTATVRASAVGVGDATATYTITVTAAPNVALAVTPTALTVTQGASANATVTLTRTNFTGAVALTLEAPAGITGTFTPASVTGDNAALVVGVAVSVAPGTYVLVIKGAATGVGDRTTTLALTVTAPGSIAIAIAPSSTSVAQGGAGEAMVNITRTNFAGAVSLSAAGAPAGVTIAFDQPTTTNNQVRLTFTATSTAVLGLFTITVTAQGTNVAPATATLALQVLASSSSQVEFQFCSASENPVFFASRDGAGAWQPVQGVLTTGVYRYRFALSQATGGVAYVQQRSSAITSGVSHGTLGTLLRPGRLATQVVPDALARLVPGALSEVVVATNYETTVLFATTTELATVGSENCGESQPTKTVWLQVAGVGNGQQATLSLGGVTELFDGDFGLSPVEFSGVRSGVIDFFGTREAQLTGVPGRILDVRGLNPADGSTLPFIADFNSTNAYDPASAQLTVSNALGDDLLNFASFYTSNGEVGLLGGSFAPSTATTRTWYGVPGAKLQVGDMHVSTIFASPAVTTTDEQRFHLQYSATVQNLAPVLGARLPTQQVSSVGTPAYRRIRVQGALPAEYADLITVQYQPSGGGNEVWLLATGAYLAATGSATAYDLSTPDLSALTGFPVAAAPAAGDWEVMAMAAGWSGVGVLGPLPANGATFLGAAKTVHIIVP